MKKILIVEDNEDNMELLLQILEDDYDIVEATNGEEAIIVAQKEKPDLILMDLSLPVMDGWEATRRLKANSELRAIPVIALTAHAMSGDKEKAISAGCDGYVSKPIDMDKLMEVINFVLKT